MRWTPWMQCVPVVFLLTACGGGGDTPPPPPTPAIYTVSAQVQGLPEASELQLGFAGGATQTVTADGQLTLTQKLPDQALYEVRVHSQPEGAHCIVVHGSGRIRAAHASGVQVRCSTDAAAALFDTARLHRFRLTLSVDDWNAFVLNTARSAYTRNAHGGSSWNLFSISEVYRRGQLEYLADDGRVLAQVPDVAFRMRGNTSRVWPEDWVWDAANSSWSGRPRRFHINLKFDEDFSGDESVYACVDQALKPAAVDNDVCMNRLADDIAPIASNEDRTFMGLESFALKYNKDDPTYVREVLAHAMLGEQGVPAGRAAHASLELRILPSARSTSLFGQPLPQTWQMGVFAMTEPVDKLLVSRLYGKNGYVFKVGGGDLTRADAADCIPFEQPGHNFVDERFCQVGVEQVDPDQRIQWLGEANASDPDIINSPINQGGSISQFAPYMPKYDLKTKKGDIAAARVAFNQLLSVINRPGATAADIAAVMDVDSFIRAQAVDIAIGAVDHYARVANNYYLYLNPQTGKWVYLPYDYDFSFRDGHIASWPLTPAFRNVISSTLFDGDNSWRNGRLSGVNPRLYDLIFADAANRDKLRARLRSVLRNWFNWQARTEPLLIHWLQRLEPAIAATQAGEPGSGDTVYQREALFGSAYSYRSWVNADNPLASAFAPGQEHLAIPSNDTLSQYVQKRRQVLLGELQ